MATTVTSIRTARPKNKIDWSQFAKFTITKLAENIYDMVITIVVLGLLLSALLITQPEMAVEYGGYIIILYVLLLARRIVQDFDDNWTIDEIGERLIELDQRIAELDRLIRADTMTDEEIEQRLHA